MSNTFTVQYLVNKNTAVQCLFMLVKYNLWF